MRLDNKQLELLLPDETGSSLAPAATHEQDQEPDFESTQLLEFDAAEALLEGPGQITSPAVSGRKPGEPESRTQPVAEAISLGVVDFDFGVSAEIAPAPIEELVAADEEVT